MFAKTTLAAALFLGLSLQAQAVSRTEALMGHFATQGGIQIQVKSGGCTWKKQFEVNHDVRSDVHHLTFIRTQEDLCRAYIPYGEILTFSFEELGLTAGDRFVIDNPDSESRVSRMN